MQWAGKIKPGTTADLSAAYNYIVGGLYAGPASTIFSSIAKANAAQIGEWGEMQIVVD